MSTSSMLKENTTTIDELFLTNYDTKGAMIYIIIVLLWYSVGIVFMLGMQMLTHSEEIEDTARRRTKFLIRDLRDHNNTKEILEELVDKQNRDRLWDIYLGTTWDTKQHLTHAETIRIRHIEKQLATIKRNQQLTHDTLLPSTNTIRYIRCRSDYRSNLSQLPTSATSNLRRRSSFDQQTLDQWKKLANQSKPYEQLPLTIRKYFRRNTKKPLISETKLSNTIISTINNEQNDHISLSNQFPKLSHGHTVSDLSTITSINDERHNPYLSYFYISSNQPIIITPEFLP